MSTHDTSPFPDGDDPFTSATRPPAQTEENTSQRQDGEDGQQEQKTKSSSRSSGGIAIGGKRVDASKYGETPTSPQFPENYAVNSIYALNEEDEHSVASYEDLHEVNKALHRARFSLNRSQRSLAQAQRQLVTSETAYRHAHARALIIITGGTEKTRTAVADLETEHLYSELLVKRAVVDEVVALVRAINRDIESLTVLSHNLRAQMNIQ